MRPLIGIPFHNANISDKQPEAIRVRAQTPQPVKGQRIGRVINARLINPLLLAMSLAMRSAIAAFLFRQD
jgi:hypothetical protein